MPPWAELEVCAMLALRVLGRPAGHRPGSPVSLSGGRDSRAPPHRPSWLGAPLLAWCAGGGCVPRPHQTRQVLAAPLLCSAKEQKRDSQQGHALGSSWSCVPPARRAVDVPQQPWLGAGLDGASSTCHPVAEALCSGCTRSRAAFFPEKPDLVLPETCSARTGCRYSTGGELCVCGDIHIT